MKTFNLDKDDTLFLFIDFQEKLMPAMYDGMIHLKWTV